MRLAFVLFLVACNSVEGPIELTSIQPVIGSVAGGTRITIEGTGLSSIDRVTIGAVKCESVSSESTRVSCTTGSSEYLEGTMDVVVTSGLDSQATLPAAFEYHCPWTTMSGRRSCGAAPPHPVTPQTASAWVTQFEDGHGFVADAGAANLADTDDFALGTRSAWIETDGAGTSRSLAKLGMPAIDMRGHIVKLWVKVDNIGAASAIELQLGDSGLANHYRMRLHSNQGQQWMTNGDWVAFTVSWSSENYTVTGSPNRGAITDVAFRVGDNGTNRVRLHVNGLALVSEPVDRFPMGVVSFTFDDNHDDMVDIGAKVLDKYEFPASAYVIVDALEIPFRATVAELHDLQQKGWDIAAHAFVGKHHEARFTTLAPSVLEDDLVDSRAWLMSNRFRGYDHCAYPGGDFTNGGANILPAIARYYASCRTIYQRQREAYPPADPYKLRVLYVTPGTTLAAARAAVDSAKANREWLILVFHQLVDEPVASTEWAKADFTALVDHVAASGMPVDTVSTVLAL